MIGSIHRVVAIAVLLLLTAATSGAAPIAGDDAFERAANAAVDRVTALDGFSGVILIARGNFVLVKRASGLADRDRDFAISPEMKFPIESISKQFTAAAILLLVQDGKIRLDDHISKYFPQRPEAWRDITLKQLLNHSSGISDCACTPKEFAQRTQAFNSYRDFIALAAATPVAFAPGTNFQYSNAGYALLTLVIEKVSGEDYGTFMSSRIFSPLAMEHTGFGSIPGDAARGYKRVVSPDGEDEEWRRGNPPRLDRLGGFGGIYSNVNDLLLWVRALDTNILLNGASRRAMFSDYGHSYGLGWRFTEKHGLKLRWHTGSDPDAAFAAIVENFPDEGLTVIALTNNVGTAGKPAAFPTTAARELVEEIERLYFTGK